MLQYLPMALVERIKSSDVGSLFIGREREFSLLLNSVKNPTADSAPVLYFDGPQGIGKSAFFNQVNDRLKYSNTPAPDTEVKTATASISLANQKRIDQPFDTEEAQDRIERIESAILLQIVKQFPDVLERYDDRTKDQFMSLKGQNLENAFLDLLIELVTRDNVVPVIMFDDINTNDPTSVKAMDKVIGEINIRFKKESLKNVRLKKPVIAIAGNQDNHFEDYKDTFFFRNMSVNHFTNLSSAETAQMLKLSTEDAIAQAIYYYSFGNPYLIGNIYQRLDIFLKDELRSDIQQATDDQILELLPKVARLEMEELIEKWLKPINSTGLSHALIVLATLRHIDESVFKSVKEMIPRATGKTNVRFVEPFLQLGMVRWDIDKAEYKVNPQMRNILEKYLELTDRTLFYNLHTSIFAHLLTSYKSYPTFLNYKIADIIAHAVTLDHEFSEGNDEYVDIVIVQLKNNNVANSAEWKLLLEELLADEELKRQMNPTKYNELISLVRAK